VIHGFVLQVLDITERHAVVTALARAEARFRTLFEAAPTATFLTDRTGTIVAANAAAALLLGYDRPQLEGRAAIELIHPEERSSARGVRRMLDKGTAANYSEERRYLRADGTTVWAQADIIQITGTSEDDGDRYLLAQLQDIGPRKRNEAELEFLAHHDALTGLLNRRGFQTALATQAQENQSTSSEAVVLVLDLDGFKSVNDRGGHAAGDRLLIEVANVLRRTLGPESAIARLGGDEFAMILPGPLSDASAAAGDAIVTAVDLATAETGAHEDQLGHHVTASAGIAAFTLDTSGDHALIAADQAMYRAKEAGRNRLSR
jgi:diguanylate cyclase (GGDEF)-like protein/PAS domain S-box-containing protein